MPIRFDSEQASQRAFAWAYRKPGAPSPYWAGDEQDPQPVPGFEHRLLKVGLGAAAVTAVGFIPISAYTTSSRWGRYISRGRIWDKYLAGIQHIEELSPVRIFRTFQYSEVFSPLGKHARVFMGEDFFNDIYISPQGERFVTPREAPRTLMARMTGMSKARLAAKGAFEQGLIFTRTGPMFGEITTAGGEVLSRAAIPLRIGTARGGTMLDWYARVMGMKLGMGEGVLSRDVANTAVISAPKVDRVLGIQLSEVAAVQLQKARTLANFSRAYWAGQIGRLNRLLESAGDIPLFGKHLSRVTKRLAIEPGTAGQMLLRYTKKGLLVAGGFEALKLLGHWRADAENRAVSTVTGAGAGALIGGALTRGKTGLIAGAITGAIVGGASVFDQGIFEGLATMWTRAHKGYAGYVSEPLGLTEAKKEQEALMPGITNPMTALGLAGTGFLGGLIVQGVSRYALQAKTAKWAAGRGLNAYDAYNQRITDFTKAIAEERGKASGLFAKTRGALWPKALEGRPLVRAAMHGGRIGALLGATLWAGAVVAASVATSHLPGLLGTEKTREELERVYSGQEEVPIRRGRWWEFGRSSFEGNRIMYYRPHWYAAMMSKARAKGLWGSEDEQLAASPVLHPLKALFDDEFKYRWEREHYYDRPYPMTGTYMEEVPFIGPLLSPLGRLIKKPVLMHTDEWLRSTTDNNRDYMPDEDESIVRRVPTTATGEPAPELGGLPPGTPVSPYRVDQETGRFIYNINELRGLTGFVNNAIHEQLTGHADYFDQFEQIQTSREAFGVERLYWEKELGGLLGQTEVVRRFIPHKRRQIEQYNPIRNTMPSWLPGPDYFLDLQHGDPYTKIQEGEIRLPGAGYAALHPEVAGLRPEEYPLFHRYKILADVAMYSEEFKKARFEVSQAAKMGLLSKDQLAQIQTINAQLSEKKKRKWFSEYQQADDTLELMRVRVKEQIAPDMFTTDSHGVIKLSGVRMAKDAIADENAQILGSGDSRRKRAIVSDYLREHLAPGSELDVYVHKDPLHRYKTSTLGAYQPAAIVSNGEDISRTLVEAGLAEYEEDNPYANISKYNQGQTMLAATWESFTHMEPAWEYLQPLSPMAKFVHQRSAVEEYERSRVYGTESAFWQHPIKHFIKPAYWMAREQLGTKEIPENVESRWEVEEYFDKLKFLKYKMLEDAARSDNNEQDAAEFRNEQRRTLFGVNPYGPLTNIFSALPTLDRDFFAQFAEADSQEERTRILELVPPNQRPIYEAQWNRQLATALSAERSMGTAGPDAAKALNRLYVKKAAEGESISPETLREYEQEEPNASYAEWSRQKQLNEYFQQYPLPGPDWVGWHPHVDLEDVKLRLVDTAGQDIHDYNLWESRRRVMMRKPYLEGSEQPLMGEPSQENPQETIRRIEATLRQVLALEDVQVTAVQSGESSEINFQMDDDRKYARASYKKDPNNFGIA